MPLNIEPITPTSTIHGPLATVSNVFSLESVGPLLRAPLKRRKVKSAVLIDTSTENKIAATEGNTKEC